MELDAASDLLRQTLVLILLVSAPILIVGLIVGIAVSLVQAVTQIQEQTLAFIPKIAAMIAVAALTLSWMGMHILDFSRAMFSFGMP
jgi:flagellar biosynthetic protein FliQ